MYKLNTGKVPYMRFNYNIIFFIHTLLILFIKLCSFTQNLVQNKTVLTKCLENNFMITYCA